MKPGDAIEGMSRRETIRRVRELVGSDRHGRRFKRGDLMEIGDALGIAELTKYDFMFEMRAKILHAVGEVDEVNRETIDEMRRQFRTDEVKSILRSLYGHLQ